MSHLALGSKTDSIARSFEGHSIKCLNIYGLHIHESYLSGRVLDSRPKGRGFEPHRRHCVVSLSKNINPSLVLVQPRKTRPFITERLLMGRKESNQTNKQTNESYLNEIIHLAVLKLLACQQRILSSADSLW